MVILKLRGIKVIDVYNGPYHLQFGCFYLGYKSRRIFIFILNGDIKAQSSPINAWYTYTYTSEAAKTTLFDTNGLYNAKA